MINEDELLRTLDEEISAAEEYIDGDIAEERETALNFYLARPMGNEEDGRSQVHDRTVFKTVMGLSTAIANIFLSEKTAIEFTPKKQGSEAQAKQQTALVSYVVFTQNKGFLALYEAIKDGVLSKAGFLTWRWQIDRTLKQETYRKQSEQSVMLLKADGWQLIAPPEIDGQMPMQAADGQLQEVPTYTVVVQKLDEKGRVVVESVPPEHVLVSPLARNCDVQGAPFVAIRRLYSKRELIAMGYAPEIVEGLPTSGSYGLTGVEREVEDQASFAEDTCLVYTCWLKRDLDGDGVQELRQVVKCENTILSNEITDEVSLSGWTPNPNTHEFMGRCPADEAVQAQRESTAIRRQMMDNLHLSNNPMIRVDASDSRVNFEDFLSFEIGKPLRAPAGSTEVFAVPFMAQHSFSILQQQQDENREITGNSVLSQGQDSSSFNNTATGARLMAGHFEQTKQFMARMFGEMCMIPAMKGVAGLLTKHCDKPFNFRVSGNYHEIDPREWADEFDMSCNVGLGVTDKQQQAMYLGQIAQAQQIAVQAGALGTLVTMSNIYNTQAKIVENAGFSDVSQFWQDPQQAQPQTPKEPPPDPQIVKAQMDAQLKQQSMEQDAQLKREEMANNAQLKQFEINANAQTQIEIERIKQQAAMLPQGQNDQAMQAMLTLLERLVIGQEQATQAALTPKMARLSNGKTVTIEPA